MMQIGSVWASMRLCGIHSDTIYAEDHRGEKYDTGDVGPRVYVMECKCGKEVRVPVHEFPGKWNLRWCGHEDCQFSPENLKQAKEAAKGLDRKKNKVAKRLGRPASTDPSVNLTISMPSSVFVRVREKALAASKSMSQRITELVCKGELKELEEGDE
jgi:hypothetical protein